MREKRCASCGGQMDRHSKICRGCYLKAVEKDPEEWRVRRNAYQQQWRCEHRERSKEIARASRARWLIANPGQAKEVQRLNRERVRKQTLDLLGGVNCATCGFADWRALQIDHRNGGGHREQRDRGFTLTAASDLWKFRAWIKANPDEAKKRYQVLCANCNWIKRHEAKECHRTAH